MRLQRISFLWCLLLALSTSLSAQNIVENKGQWEAPVRFKLPMHYGDIYFEQDGLKIVQADPDGALFYEKRHHFDHQEDHNHKNESVEPSVQRYHAYRMKWVNPQPDIKVSGQNQLEGYHNYILGNDRSKWQSQVGLFQTLDYKNVYNGIDVRFYFNASSNLKYDVLVAPKADPDQYQLQYDGTDSLWVDEEGVLHIETSIAEVKELKPYAYQRIDGEKVEVNCKYSIDGHSVRFKLGRYDSQELLIIDPELVFSSFISSTARVFGHSATPSINGDIYGAGIVFGGSGYPTSNGAFQRAFSGTNQSEIDVVVTKLSANGSNLIYSTYLGGHFAERPYSIIEDSTDKSLVIYGSTVSNNFPVSSNAPQSSIAGAMNPQYPDYFISKLDSTGGALVGSTYWGGSQNDGTLDIAELQSDVNDEFRGEVVLDENGTIYISGKTNSADFPVTAGAAQVVKGSSTEAIIASFSSDLSLNNWSTFFGGNAHEAAYGVKIQGDEAYVCGATNSNDLRTNATAYKNQINGSTDGFLLKLNAQNGAFKACTYLGGTNKDVTFFVDFTPAGNPCVLGTTRSTLPITNIRFSGQNQGLMLQEIKKDFSDLVHSTIVGPFAFSNQNMSPSAFEVDYCGNLLFSSFGGVATLPVSDNAIKEELIGISDLYLFVMDASWDKINYATYFGGDNNQYGEHVDGGTSRFANDGTIYQAICASCYSQNNFPTTPGSYGEQKGAGDCNLAVVKFSTDSRSILAHVEPEFDSVCQFSTINLLDSSYNVDTYELILPDGTTVSVDSLDAVFIPNLGLNRFFIKTIDTTCGLLDSTEINIYAYAMDDNLQFKADYDSCTPYADPLLTVSFESNYSEGFRHNWNFGDGMSSTAASPTHTYGDEGTYTVELEIYLESCSDTLTASRTVLLHAVAPLNITIDYDLCQEDLVYFNSEGDGYHSFYWDFNGIALDSLPSVQKNLVSSEGVHTIQCIAIDTICNRTDTVLKTFESEFSSVSGEFPNIFTPNGDGANDTFGLIGDFKESDFKSFGLEVYNRWGQLVYATDNPNAKWDGIERTDVLPAGVYFYQASYLSRCDLQEVKRGFVHLIR